MPCLGSPGRCASGAPRNVDKVNPEEARELAHRWLATRPWWSDDAYSIVRVERISTTWVVGWNSQIYAETGESSHALAGNGPILISDDGRIVQAGTARPTEDYVADFES